VRLAVQTSRQENSQKVEIADIETTGEKGIGGSLQKLGRELAQGTAPTGAGLQACHRAMLAWCISCGAVAFLPWVLQQTPAKFSAASLLATCLSSQRGGNICQAMHEKLCSRSAHSIQWSDEKWRREIDKWSKVVVGLTSQSDEADASARIGGILGSVYRVLVALQQESTLQRTAGLLGGPGVQTQSKTLLRGFA
jgi:hypothetical protein